MRRSLFVGAASLALVATHAAPAAAQATIGWDASVFSSYVWRGLSLTNKPVLQPDLWISFPVGAAAITVGGWATIDIGKYDGSEDISESGGTSAFNFAEFDPWAEIAITAGLVTITPGVTAYIYPNKAGITDDFNTVEVYTKLGLSTILSPKIAAYYDVDKVKGLYVEGSVSHGIPLGAASLNLGVLAGFNAGQGVDPDDFAANFADDGFTHLDISAGIPFSAGSLSINPSVHLVVAGDDFTKVTKPNSTSDTKLWGGITLSWSHGGGEEEEE